jgi:hypothetical protein
MLNREKEEALNGANTVEVLPIWVRMPGACRASGLGKSRIYELLSEAGGRIKTVLLKSPGGKGGARLINLPSLLSYLDNLATAEMEGAN